MLETLFAFIGVTCVIVVSYLYVENFIYKLYYNALRDELNSAYYKVVYGSRESYSREHVEVIIGLLHNRYHVNYQYFEEQPFEAQSGKEGNKCPT